MGDSAKIGSETSVSVIIPNYNYSRFLPDAIESVLAQTLPCDEILVVDDGSTDNSFETLAGYEKFGVKVIRQKNRGVGAARNAGVAASTGTLLAFLDADDYWFPQKIEKQLARLMADDKCGLVTCGMQEVDLDGNVINQYNDGLEGWCAEDLLLIKPVVVGPGSTTLIRRVIFEQIGGYDETKEMYPSEDWEFSYRAARAAKLAFISELLVGYRNHGGNGHLQIPRFERAMKIAFEKTFSSDDKDVLRFKRRSYGNLYKILAGSYMHANQYGECLKNAAKSLFYTPENLAYFAAFPLRKRQRKGYSK